MLLVQANPALGTPIEAEWRLHFADGLARLRRTPSGEVRRACDLLLDDSEPWGLEFALRLSRGETSIDERLAFFEATRRRERFCSLDVNPVDALRIAIPVLIENTDDAALRAHLADELVSMGEATLPRAVMLRRTLFPLLRARFGGSLAD